MIKIISKLNSTLVFSITSLIVLITFYFFTIDRNNNKIKSGDKFSEENFEEEAGYEIAIKYFSVWNHPYGNNIPENVLAESWSQINLLPDETSVDAEIISPWKCIGPFGISRNDSPSVKYTGRVKDIEAPNNTTGLRVGAASGGIWSYSLIFPINISNGIETPWLGTFATDPDDNNIIYAGTGEPAVMPGRGLWRTTNGGANWHQVYFDGFIPWCFYKIRFDPNNSNKLHAVTTEGYFRSDDNGNSWQRKYPGIITDFAINVYNNSNTIYITKKNPTGIGGILKSTNGGDTFVQLTGYPNMNTGRSVIDCGNSPNIVYALIGDSSDTPKGVFKSENSGANWVNITPTGMQAFMLKSVEYMAVISVCPTNPAIVFAGTKSLCRSSDGGLTWAEYLDYGNTPVRNIHGDHHRLVWKDGNTVYSANDGGVAISSDRGITWSTSINTLPLTQSYHFDVGISNKNVIYSGTQDNGTIKSENLGFSWSVIIGGDGGTNEIDPTNSNKVFFTHLTGGVIPYNRLKTVNGGLNWSNITGNLPPHNDFIPRMTSDQTQPLYLYTNAGSFIFKSTNEGTLWTQMNTPAFPGIGIFNFTVSKYITNTGSLIYASLMDTPESGNHSGKLLRVFDNGTWYERSSGLPVQGAWVRNVSIHPNNVAVAYAVMNGFNGQKVFKTSNRGVNWVNISGDLPNIPVSDIIPHPSDNNILYLSTEFGCYKSNNGGVNWIRWNYGMPDKLPQATTINDLDVIDSLALNGRYYILAATYGRGIWMREISSDDPIGIINNSIPNNYSLSQNFPNPFNPVTQINYSILKSENVKLYVFDVLGKVVKIICNEKKSAGSHTVEFNASKLASGIYFYRLETDNFKDTKKMILLK